MNFNEDGNLMGRVLALALLVGVVVGVRGLCGYGCAFCFSGAATSAAAPSSDAAPSDSR
jgi:hypothetical protein